MAKTLTNQPSDLDTASDRHRRNIAKYRRQARPGGQRTRVFYQALAAEQADQADE